MRIRTGKTKNGRLFYVIKTYYDTKGIELLTSRDFDTQIKSEYK